MADLGRILLAEDSDADLELTLAALAEHNLANEVVVARDGAEALEYLQRRGQYKDRGPGQPAVILLDLKMPRVDGLEVLRVVKNDPELQRVPVVMLTSSREERDLVDSYQLGVNAYVVKPVDFTQFLEAVKQLGMFWAVVNEPPPGTMGRSERR
jgi:CheY-like chemotaxis protein